MFLIYILRGHEILITISNENNRKEDNFYQDFQNKKKYNVCMYSVFKGKANFKVALSERQELDIINMHKTISFKYFLHQANCTIW